MPQDHRPHRPQQGGQRPMQNERQPEALPRIQFSTPLDPELFNTTAQQAAQVIANAGDRNKTAQLRRFYDELCMWEEKVSREPGKFNDYLPFIRMLNAKAAYAEGRKLVDRNFVHLLQHTLAQVNDAGSLTICKLFWEAFMGFYKQKRPN